MQKSENMEISGTVAGIVFRNDENGYTVLRLVQHGETGLTTAVGTLPSISRGEVLTLYGVWKTHSEYGMQFEVSQVAQQLPKTEKEIYDYLASGAVHGIGPSIAKQIVTRHGADTLRVLDEEPEKLAEIKGISVEKAREFGEIYRQQTALRRLSEFFSAYGLNMSYALKAYSKFGDDAQAALTDDPYLLTDYLMAGDYEDTYYGANFREVDEFAQKLNFEANSPERLQAALVYVLRHNAEDNGHSFIPLNRLIQRSAGMLHVSETVFGDALDDLVENGLIVRETIAGEDACFLRKYYTAEVYVAERLRAMAETRKTASYDANNIWKELSGSIELAESQKEAVRQAAGFGAFALTGGPGTGKTTTLRAILTLFERMGLKTLLTAPTGRAAKRMTDLTGRDAQTIHRLLDVKFDKKTGQFIFFHNKGNPLAADAVILDEASMVDIVLMKALLSALKPTARLILVGDADQLPSVGAGNMFRDVLNSGVVPTVRLTEVFRQAAASLITRNAHRINHGESPVNGVKSDDFFIMVCPNGEETARCIEDLCTRRLPNSKFGLTPDQIQVLSPTRINGTGTRALNIRLQGVLNPPSDGKREKKFGEYTYREGDRVMQVRNNYELTWQRLNSTEVGMGVFNGDVGTISAIDAKTHTVTVDFEDRRADYEFAMLNELEPAYAVTVHKAQGSEYRAVILALMNVPQTLLTRSLLYTAVTRARDLLIIVGEGDLIHQMVANDRPQKRYSGLKVRLQEEKPSAPPTQLVAPDGDVEIADE